MSLRSAQHESLAAGQINARRIACVNDTPTVEIPVYSIVAGRGGFVNPHVATSTREYMRINYPTGTDDALFVTMGKDLTASSPGLYGHCWSVLSGPLWMNYETGESPAVGDIVGPVADSFKVSADGSGFRVLQVDVANERVRAVFLGGGSGGGGNIIVDIDPDSVDMDCGCYKATATVVRTLCSGGPSVGEMIDVYDDMGCHLNVPAGEMPTRFMASETKGDPYLGEDPLPYGCDDPYDDPQACHWTIFAPCCAE